MLSAFTADEFRGQGFARKAMTRIGEFVDTVATPPLKRDGALIAQQSIIPWVRPIFPLPVYERKKYQRSDQYQNYVLWRRNYLKKGGTDIISFEGSVFDLDREIDSESNAQGLKL